MKPEGLRFYADRAWAAVERSKRGYWAQQYASRGCQGSLRAAGDLRIPVQTRADSASLTLRTVDVKDLIGFLLRTDAAIETLSRSRQS